jgi:hypothetical protein
MGYKPAHYLLLISSLGSCAVTPPAREDRGADLLAGRTAGKPQSCVTLFANENLTIIGNDRVGYRDGNTIWVSRPQSPCEGLDPTNTLLIERHGSQLCRGDQIRVIRPPTGAPGPICVLGDFVPYR